MSQRVTFKQVKYQVGWPVGQSPDSCQYLDLFNEGTQILWNMGDWIGKNQVYRLKVTADCHGNKCIAWPYQIETIEHVNICGRPIGVRNQYFEFLFNALRSGDNYGFRRSGISLASDKSESCTQEDLVPGGKKLKIYTERIEEKGRILLLGYDDNGNWIRTYFNNEWHDGEYLDLANAPSSTLNNFSAISGVQFDGIRNGNVYLYSVDSDNVEYQLATYDYSVETPVFRRSVIGGLGREHPVSVKVLAKMRFIPVKFDTDYPQISNVPALKSILQHIYYRDQGDFQKAEAYKFEALSYLNDELKQYNGYGAKKILNFGPRDVFSTSRSLQ